MHDKCTSKRPKTGKCTVAPSECTLSPHSEPKKQGRQIFAHFLRVPPYHFAGLGITVSPVEDGCDLVDAPSPAMAATTVVFEGFFIGSVINIRGSVFTLKLALFPHFCAPAILGFGFITMATGEAGVGRGREWGHSAQCSWRRHAAPPRWPIPRW